MAKEKWLVQQFCQHLERVDSTPHVSIQQEGISVVWEQMCNIWDADPAQYTLENVAALQEALDSATWDDHNETASPGNLLVELLLAQRSLQLLQALPSIAKEVGYL